MVEAIWAGVKLVLLLISRRDVEYAIIGREREIER